MSELTIAGQRIGRIPDASSPELLPCETPLDMPDQDFAKRDARAPRMRRGYWIPRAALFAGSLILTAAFGYELYGVLGLEQLTPIQLLFLVLSTIAFGWIALGSLSAALGFLPLFSGEKVDTIELPPPDGAVTARTALLFPVYHEVPAHVAGTVQAIALELQSLDRASAFDVFILSDTRGDREGALEEAAFAPLKRRLMGAHPRLLSPSPRQCRAQVRQHQGLGAPLRR